VDSDAADVQDAGMGMDTTATLAVAVLVVALAGTVYLVVGARGRRGIATPEQRATYDVLHRAGLAAEPLRLGLDATTAAKAAPHLHALVGGVALGLADAEHILVLEGVGSHHRGQLEAAAQRAVRSGRTAILRYRDLPCDLVDCPIRGAVVAPFHALAPFSASTPAASHHHQAGALSATAAASVAARGAARGAVLALAGGDPGPGLVQATLETARFVATQLALAELDSSRARLARAEVRALRAQISPHFVYNALTAIASFVRTDPERARELILEFAEFTRYSFRAHGEYTTLAEELRSIDRYLTIERARFGDRLQVRLQIAPEVLPVGLPFLCLQPLVENAVRHGLSRKPGLGTVAVIAHDAGAECVITVEDDGVGMDPGVLSGPGADPNITDGGGDAGQHVGLANVDERLRAAFGDGFGLVVETALGAGTKVSMRVPKFRPDVRARADVGMHGEGTA
jgi:two-component system LytT family sensor kinase